MAVDPRPSPEGVRQAALDRAIIARAGLYEFVRRSWPVAVKKPFVDGRHVRVLCEFLEEITGGSVREFVIDVPPGTGKSWVASVLWPAWVWTGPDPDHRWICSSYSDRLVRRDSMRCRALVESLWYQDRWGLTVTREGICREDDWSTTSGGGRVSATTGGQITGEHGDTFLVDDPLKPDDAHFDRAELRRVWQWIEDTVPTRMLNPATGAIGAIMQRLHQSDPAGRLIARGARHLVLPMRFEANHPQRSEADWRTEEGELLWPEGRSEEAVQVLERQLTPYGVAGQLQQRPVPEGGGVFKTEWLEPRWATLPKRGGVWIQSWDCAFKGTEAADFVVGQVWVQQDGYCDLVHQVRGRWSFSETVEQVLLVSRAWPQADTILVEDKANGTAVMDALRSVLSGLTAVEPLGGKEARAHAVSRLFRALQVRLPMGQPWVDAYVAEMETFPAGANDDQVDATTQALAFLASDDLQGYVEMVRGMAKSLPR